MIFRRFAPGSQSGILPALYGAIVAQARAPAFYRSYGVPDTVGGRLEMLMLHIVLVLRHLEGDLAQNGQLGQALFDCFCRDMDANMREMGIGDLAVPRKMRRVGEAFYGRQAMYRAALAVSDNSALVLALERSVFAGALQPENAARLAAYCRQAVRRISGQSGFDRGEIVFPDPDRIAVHVVVDHE